MVLLDEILQYYDMCDDPVDTIQIVTADRDWDDADEVKVDSDLLSPFYQWEVTAMRCEMSFMDDRPVLRVLIEPQSGDNTNSPAEMLGFLHFSTSCHINHKATVRK